MQQFMMQLRHGDILVSDSPDTKFGALPETPLDGFIRAAQWDVETLASISQTPTYELTGQLVNLSADALVAARGGQMRKTSDWQQALEIGRASCRERGWLWATRVTCKIEIEMTEG